MSWCGWSPQPGGPANPNASLPRAAPAFKTGLFLWLGLLVVAAPVLLYAQVLQFDFVGLDDSFYVTDNPFVRAGLVPQSYGGELKTFRAASNTIG